MQYGLIGEKLTHSFSKQIHGMLGDYSYDLISLPAGELGGFLRSNQWQGLNITIPYKKAVIPFCDELSQSARTIGSVNTLVRKDGKIYGDNTDLYGFCAMAERAGISFLDKKVLILGSGGTSLTAQQAARQGGAKQIVVVSRNGTDNYENISAHADANCIVNTTPVGMYPENGKAPIDLSAFSSCEGVLDVIYNPLRTELVLKAKALGKKSCGGLYMLVAQAKRASELFIGKELADTRIIEIHKTLLKQLSNIVLIGMPGSGKTCVGKAVAEHLGRKHVDVDERIAQSCGISAANIIRSRGEEEFRRIESQIIAEVSKQTGVVVSTGGGAVTREENYAPLKQNGVLFFLDRDSALLPTDNRPLSAGKDAVQKLYQTRLPLYRRFADCSIDGNGTLESTASRIWEAYDEIACD